MRLHDETSWDKTLNWKTFEVLFQLHSCFLFNFHRYFKLEFLFLLQNFGNQKPVSCPATVKCLFFFQFVMFSNSFPNLFFSTSFLNPYFQPLFFNLFFQPLKKNFHQFFSSNLPQSNCTILTIWWKFFQE